MDLALAHLQEEASVVGEVDGVKRRMRHSLPGTKGFLGRRLFVSGSIKQ